MRNTFVDTVTAAIAGRNDVMFISGDAGLGVFDELRQQSPDSFLNLGVAEQNMASFAAGLALGGCKVFLYNIIPFLLYRCYEQVRNDICYQKLPVVLVGIGSGVTYAPGGMSHYSIEDLGVTVTLPNLTVISPADVFEVRAAAEYSLHAAEPVYIRLGRLGKVSLHQEPLVDVLQPVMMQAGEDCALLFHGSIADEVIAAARLLDTHGVKVALVSIPTLHPFAAESVAALLQGKRLVVTVEEHYAHTGLGGIVARLAAEIRPGWRLATRGIPERFIHEVAGQAGMRRLFGLSSEQIAGDVMRLLHEK